MSRSFTPQCCAPSSMGALFIPQLFRCLCRRPGRLTHDLFTCFSILIYFISVTCSMHRCQSVIQSSKLPVRSGWIFVRGQTVNGELEFDLCLSALITSSQSLPEHVLQMVFRAQKVKVDVSPEHMQNKARCAAVLLIEMITSTTELLLSDLM